MFEQPSPFGSWQFTVRRLGPARGPTDEVVVLARFEPDGRVTLSAAGPADAPRIASWTSAGPGRIVVVADWYVRDGAGGPVGRISVHAATELSADGRTCRARGQWRRVDLAGLRPTETMAGEADGRRLQA